ncbi:MAG: PAS domain-containing sensor histidine kinase [Vampirovibrio sp.]|nr:PAS domain-containing sensor histidine kinase [Vampirovibrio sp.]
MSVDTQIHQLAKIIDALPTGLIILSGPEQIVQINQRACDILRINSETSTPSLQDLPEYLIELRLLLSKADGDIARSEMSVLLPGEEEPAIIGFSLKQIDTDTTGHGSLETLRAFIFSDITHVIKDRLSFEKIKDELNQSKKLASIGTMISGVAHELNNPLTGISMSSDLTQMALNNLKKKLDPAIEKDAQILAALDKALTETQKISTSCNKAAVLVNDLLTYSKPVQLMVSPEDAYQLILEMEQALKTHPDFGQVIFNIENPDIELPILCDKVKLEQVFYNLFKNAADATEGKGTLTVKFERSHQVMEDKKEKSFVTVHVQDNGPGIDKTVLARIFDPFFTTKGSAGVGLGLSISYRTLEQHGGLLSVDSEKGVGTTFHVAIPLFEEGAAFEDEMP